MGVIIKSIVKNTARYVAGNAKTVSVGGLISLAYVLLPTLSGYFEKIIPPISIGRYNPTEEICIATACLVMLPFLRFADVGLEKLVGAIDRNHTYESSIEQELSRS